MISIGSALNDLDRAQLQRSAAVEAYALAVRNMAQYAVDLDDSLTPPYRQHLYALADRMASGKPEAIEESRSSLRGIMRDYRDGAARFLTGLRDDLASTARALEEIMDSLTQQDGDQEARLRSAVKQVREAATGSSAPAIRAVILPATEAIEDSLAKIHTQHQLTVAQFQAEIHMLHQRIDTLETAVSIDAMSALLKRAEMEERIREAVPPFSILMLRAQGIRSAEAKFGRAVAAECAAAFGKRLRSGIPLDAVVGRWGDEEFLALVHVDRVELIPVAKWAAQNLSGSYSCMLNGKTVCPQLQVSAALAEGGGLNVLQRVTEFLGDPPR